jgi:hypothetical protein
MLFWNYKSNYLYEIYLNLFDSDFATEKKKIILKSLFVGEHFSWKIIGISKLCFKEYKKNNFKKVTKFKKINKKFIRHKFITFFQTAEILFSKKFPAKDFWEIIIENEKTHLITKEERDSKEYFYIDIPIEGGYFLNQNSSFEYSTKEEYFLKILDKEKIKWKQQSLILKDIK